MCLRHYRFLTYDRNLLCSIHKNTEQHRIGAYELLRIPVLRTPRVNKPEGYLSLSPSLFRCKRSSLGSRSHSSCPKPQMAATMFAQHYERREAPCQPKTTAAEHKLA